MSLKENFRDCQIAPSGKRYILTNNSDGTVCIDNATEYTVVGDKIGALELNEINSIVLGEEDRYKFIDSIVQKLSQMGYGYITSLSQCLSVLDTIAQTSYSSGYSAGVREITSNPNRYNLYTQSDYDYVFQLSIEFTSEIEECQEYLQMVVDGYGSLAPQSVTPWGIYTADPLTASDVNTVRNSIYNMHDQSYYILDQLRRGFDTYYTDARDEL